VSICRILCPALRRSDLDSLILRQEASTDLTHHQPVQRRHQPHRFGRSYVRQANCSPWSVTRQPLEQQPERSTRGHGAQ
jgi:hypothetical protein